MIGTIFVGKNNAPENHVTTFVTGFQTKIRFRSLIGAIKPFKNPGIDINLHARLSGGDDFLFRHRCLLRCNGNICHGTFQSQLPKHIAGSIRIHVVEYQLHRLDWSRSGLPLEHIIIKRPCQTGKNSKKGEQHACQHQNQQGFQLTHHHLLPFRRASQ